MHRVCTPPAAADATRCAAVGCWDDRATERGDNAAGLPEPPDWTDGGVHRVSCTFPPAAACDDAGLAITCVAANRATVTISAHGACAYMRDGGDALRAREGGWTGRKTVRHAAARTKSTGSSMAATARRSHSQASSPWSQQWRQLLLTRC